jgi:hypothetical protein
MLDDDFFRKEMAQNAYFGKRLRKMQGAQNLPKSFKFKTKKALREAEEKKL